MKTDAERSLDHAPEWEWRIQVFFGPPSLVLFQERESDDP